MYIALRCLKVVGGMVIVTWYGNCKLEWPVPERYTSFSCRLGQLDDLERLLLLLERNNNDGSKKIEYWLLTNKCILWSRIFFVLYKFSCNIAQSNEAWLINWLMLSISDQYFSFINDCKSVCTWWCRMGFMMFITPLSTLFHIDRGGKICWWRK
jgi:hypothetical protein